MSVGGQFTGQLGRIIGDAQLRGHFGRIPFALAAPSTGKALLSELVCGSATLTAAGPTASLSEAPTGSTRLSVGGAVGVLSELAAGSAELSEDC